MARRNGKVFFTGNSNADSEYRNIWTTTALSDVAELEDAVNLWLAPELDSSEVGWFDLSNVVALQPPSVFAPPMVTDMLNAGVIDVQDVAKILNLPAVEAPGEDASTAPIGEEAIQSGAQGGRSFLYRSSHRGPYHPGEGYRAVHHGMRLADNVFVKRLPLNRYTLDSGVWRVEERREKAITVRSLPRPVPQPMLAIELVARADRNRQFREAGYRAAPKLIASGLVVKAADTGRVLMLQRRFDDEKDPARGKFEFPGGHVEPGEDSLDAAHREWEEEVGHKLAHDSISGSWTSPNQIYRGHVQVIPHETDVDINASKPRVKNPDNPKGKYTETAAWFHVDHIADNPAVRDEVRKTADTWKPVVEMAQSIDEAGGRSLPAFEDFDAFSQRLEALVS
jgi:8-oxo-dGTP pyrophosphatase MutT (NUDIX family)